MQAINRSMTTMFSIFADRTPGVVGNKIHPLHDTGPACTVLIMLQMNQQQHSTSRRNDRVLL